MFSRVHRFILYSGFFLLLNAAAFGSSDTNRGPGEVLIIEHPQATHTFTPQRPHVKEMVRTGLLRFTGKSSTKQAWLSILSTNDVVGLKVFSSPGRNSGTRPAVVAEVIETLLEAGIAPRNIVVWDRRISDLRLAGFFELAEKYQVRVQGSQEAGYDPTVFYPFPLIGNLVYSDLDFGKKGQGIGRNSYVSKLLTTQITKVVNIAPLLNHNAAGVSGVLYGLTMGSVDNTLRFELDEERLAQAIPEIYALAQIGDHVVLNIVDALICQYQGEETSLLHYSVPLNQLWFSTDPVALDVLALKQLERQRQAANVPEPKINRSIYTNCAVLDLGIADSSKIKIDQLTLKSTLPVPQRDDSSQSDSKQSLEKKKLPNLSTGSF